MESPFGIGQSANRFMRRIQSGMHAKVRTLGENVAKDIGPHGGFILNTLAEGEPMPVQELVRIMARDKSQMTRKIKDLEAKSLIVRTQCPTDGRVSLLSLSDEGRDIQKKLQRALTSVIEEILSPLSEEEQSQLAQLLQKI